jgi:protein SCO1
MMMTLQFLRKRNRSAVCALFIFQLFIVDSLFAKQVTIDKNIPSGEIYEKLNQKIDLNLMFTNQDGKRESIKDLFKNEKVLIVTLNYYKCTTMCTFQFVNLASTLKKMDWPIGNGFRIATISFDPNDTVAVAKEKQKLWVPQTGQRDAKWDFFVGGSKDINALVKELNFFYERDTSSGEYSHGAALFFIKPDGTFYRYLYGIVYDPQDIKHALIESSNGELGSFIERMYTKLKKYQSQIGKYASR